MKKTIALLSILLITFSLVSCKKTPKVTFMYDTGEIVKELKVKKGTNVEYPTLSEVEGYYYEFDKTLEELKNVKSDITVIIKKVECDKICNYYIDNDLIKSETLKYKNTPNYPPFLEYAINQTWEEKIEREGNKYIATYTLSYERIDPVKTKVEFYDGDNLLDLKVIREDEYDPNLILPTYSKEGYEFLGWYLSKISDTEYTEIDGKLERVVKLYAKFINLGEKVELPNSSAHFTDILKKPHGSNEGVFVYQPVFPQGYTSSVTLYDWSTSNSSIATVSAYSSISVRETGYCVLTARLKSDPTIVINCVIKTNIDGVFMSSEEEANSNRVVTVTFVGKDEEIIKTQKTLKGSSVIPPTPLEYEGLAFAGWDKEVYNIQEDTTIKATYVEGKNEYVGKKFAFIGDSISTYIGYIPDGYACFYPYPTADVNDYNQTWWMEVVNKLGAKLFVNNSYSGSCVATGNTSASTNDARLSQLVLSKEKPDVIIIFMGSNDCASGSINDASFKNAYSTMLRKIEKLCPDSEVILCTLPVSNLYNTDKRDRFNTIITDLAKAKELKVVNLDQVDIRPYLVDSAHPGKEGMEKVAEQVIKDLLK